MFDHDKLQALMEFDHVIYVSADGAHAESAQNELYAPTVERQDGQTVVHGRDWEIVTQGLTGQYGGGDTLHPSEVIPGAVANRVLTGGGGYYAAVPVEYYCDADAPECYEESEDRMAYGCDCEPVGWSVVRYKGAL